ncbi:LodA/GoxA family CTQ-dependent oxidase [Nocardia sp. CWNU-33]|uniref:LodA/GoxA family CTQ-dependent oxidase n=1 Tax=Nocardia sp. CWNU-33 TaxID=3392117 RepID=UPI00398F256B
MSTSDSAATDTGPSSGGPPRPSGLAAASPPPAGSDTDPSHIAFARIHPGIGVARVGNSPDEFFPGPEAPGIPANPEGQFKDAQGGMKRQAARFRLYGYNTAGKVVRELTAAEASCRRGPATRATHAPDNRQRSRLCCPTNMRQCAGGPRRLRRGLGAA